MKYFYIVFLMTALWSGQAVADITSWHKIEKMTVGTNGIHGTSVVLSETSFNGCAVSSAALIEAGNPNYEGFLSLLLAAKMAGKDVRVTYSGCSNNYPKVTEIQI